MNRFEYALQATVSPLNVNLPQLAQQFSLAVDQVTAEGLSPGEDPAVLLLGTFISFQCHADVNTRQGFEHLIALCNDRLHIHNNEVLQ